MNYIEKEEINVCEICEGSGWTIDDENSEEGDVDLLKEICYNCQGSGVSPID